MRRVLVLFATHHGQTRTIAFRVAETLRARGMHVHLRDIADEQPDPSHYDAVVVGSPIEMNHHDRAIARWVKRNAWQLNKRPGAFFSVSMSAASAAPAERAALDQLIERFLAETHWQAAPVARFGGALRYTQYGWLTRQVMRTISKAQGHPTDTSRDWEFTDWAHVDRFASEVAGFLAQFEPAWAAA